jgi:hypothetical protein
VAAVSLINKPIALLLFLAAATSAVIVPMRLTQIDVKSIPQPQDPSYSSIQISTTGPSESWIAKPIFGDEKAAPAPDAEFSSFESTGVLPTPLLGTPTLPGPFQQAPIAKSEGSLTPLPPPPPPLPNLPLLSGIIIGKGKSLAIVTGSSGSARKLPAGQTVDGWRLTRINRSSVVFTYKKETREIFLQYEQLNLSGERYSAQAVEAASEPSEDGPL